MSVTMKFNGRGDRKDSEVVLHLYKEVFTYSARNN